VRGILIDDFNPTLQAAGNLPVRQAGFTRMLSPAFAESSRLLQAVPLKSSRRRRIKFFTKVNLSQSFYKKKKYCPPVLKLPNFI